MNKKGLLVTNKQITFFLARNIFPQSCSQSCKTFHCLFVCLFVSQCSNYSKILTITSKRLLRVRNTVGVGSTSSVGILRGFGRNLPLSFLLLRFDLLSSDSIKFKVRVIRLRLNLRLWCGVVVFVDGLPLLEEMMSRKI